MQLAKITLVILISIAFLSACGLKGPLYLPDESPAKIPATGQEPDPFSDQEDKQDEDPASS